MLCSPFFPTTFKGCPETPGSHRITVLTSALRPRYGSLVGGHCKNAQAPSVSLNLSSAGPSWPWARARAAGCTPQLGKAKPPAALPLQPLRRMLLARCSHCKRGPPLTPTATAVTLLPDWHLSGEGARGNYVSRALQTCNFPKHMDIWGKEQLVT